MGKMRSEWQAFKKKYPDFEKGKKFKADAGPRMDDFEKQLDEIDADIKKFEAMMQEVYNTGSKVSAAFKQYEAIVEESKKTDKAMEHDFDKVRDGIRPYSFPHTIRRNFLPHVVNMGD